MRAFVPIRMTQTLTLKARYDMGWPKRRRSSWATPPGKFDGAFHHIDKLERKVIGTVERSFDMMTFPRAFWPDDIVDKLTAAYPYVHDADRDNNWCDTIDLELNGTKVQCTFNVDTESLLMLRPGDDTVTVRETAAPFINVLAKIHHEVAEFHKVRQVVEWLNANATPGAAKFYCPWLAALLDENHPFHAMTGIKLDEPKTSMAEIAPVMRECGSIIATALMAPETVDLETSFTMTFRSPDGPNTSRQSNTFLV